MKQSVMLLLGFLLTLSISGCSPRVEYIKCVTPNVATPILSNERPTSSLQASKQCLYNYLQQKKYAEQLLKANQVCK